MVVRGSGREAALKESIDIGIRTDEQDVGSNNGEQDERNDQMRKGKVVDQMFRLRFWTAIHHELVALMIRRENRGYGME